MKVISKARKGEHGDQKDVTISDNKYQDDEGGNRKKV